MSFSGPIAKTAKFTPQGSFSGPVVGPATFFPSASLSGPATGPATFIPEASFGGAYVGPATYIPGGSVAVNPTLSLAETEIKVRWEANYTSDELNARFFGFPRGIYKGFDPEVIPGAPATQLRLKIDPSQGVSVGMVRSELSSRDVQMFLTRELILDFAGTITFPVYVKLKAQYKVGQTTSAQVFTDTTPPNNFDQVGICRVRQPGGPGTDIVVDATDITVPDNRNTPVASIGQDFGFMPGGSFEDLQAASALITEVTNARTDVDTGFAHPDLSARLIQDFLTIASRLQRQTSVLRGNIHTIPSGSLPQGSLFVSGSLSNLPRAFLPARTFDEGGAPGVGGAGSDGVITVAPDNKVVLRDEDTGNQFLDLTTNRPVYGRLTKLPNTISTGTSNYVNASTTVSKAAGDYVAEGVVAGMRVIAPDGNAYEVLGPVNPLDFQISPAYQGVNAATIGQVFELFRADFFISDGAGGETPYVFPAGPDVRIQPYFNAITDLDGAQRDSVLDLLCSLGTVVQNLAKTDGSTPFTAPQGGIDGVAPTDLVTLAQITALLIPDAQWFAARSSIGGNPINWNIIEGNDSGFVVGGGGTVINVPSAGKYIVVASLDANTNVPLAAISLRHNGVARSTQDSSAPVNFEPSVTLAAGMDMLAGGQISVTGAGFGASGSDRVSIFVVKVK